MLHVSHFTSLPTTNDTKKSSIPRPRMNADERGYCRATSDEPRPKAAKYANHAKNIFAAEFTESTKAGNCK